MASCVIQTYATAPAGPYYGVIHAHTFACRCATHGWEFGVVTIAVTRCPIGDLDDKLDIIIARLDRLDQPAAPKEQPDAEA